MTIVFCHFRNLCEFKLNYLPVFVLVDESAFQLSYKISLSIDTWNSSLSQSMNIYLAGDIWSKFFFVDKVNVFVHFLPF